MVVAELPLCLLAFVGSTLFCAVESFKASSVASRIPYTPSTHQQLKKLLLLLEEVVLVLDLTHMTPSQRTKLLIHDPQRSSRPPNPNKTRAKRELTPQHEKQEMPYRGPGTCC